MTRNSATDWGWPAKNPALGRRYHDSPLARPWLVDDAYDPASGAARQLRRAFGHGIRPARSADPAAAVALAQPLAGSSRRAAALGACRGARVAHSPLFSDVRGLAHGLDGRHHIPQSHDQGFVR